MAPRPEDRPVPHWPKETQVLVMKRVLVLREAMEQASYKTYHMVSTAMGASYYWGFFAVLLEKLPYFAVQKCKFPGYLPSRKCKGNPLSLLVRRRMKTAFGQQ